MEAPPPAPVPQVAKGRLDLGRSALGEVACAGGRARSVWNHFLALNVERYEKDKTSAF